MSGQELMIHPALQSRLTLDALAEAVGLHPAIVEQFVDYGLLEPVAIESKLVWFDLAAVRRLRTIRRLREDLGINPSGIAVVLDLLVRIESLQRELAEFRRADIRRGMR
jgi:DNA-binding transcriptional MerR regulator